MNVLRYLKAVTSFFDTAINKYFMSGPVSNSSSEKGNLGSSDMQGSQSFYQNSGNGGANTSYGAIINPGQYGSSGAAKRDYDSQGFNDASQI